MISIALISDLHGRRLHTPFADILIAAGDMTDHGLEGEFIRLNDWFAEQPQETKLYVPGNHDKLAYKNPSQVREILSNATMLIDETITVNGVTIYGSPWVPSDNPDWAFPLMFGSGKAREKWKAIPEGLDILITHGPPYGISDKHHKTGEHLGCGHLINRLREMQQKPKYHVFGHVHEGVRITDRYGIYFVNAAVCDEKDRVARPPIIIERDWDGNWSVPVGK